MQFLKYKLILQVILGWNFLKQQENLIGNIYTMECDKELLYTHIHKIKLELL